jgi:hypothetical protein
MDLKDQAIEKTKELLALSQSSPQNGQSTCLCIDLLTDSAEETMNLIGTAFQSTIQSQVPEECWEKYTYYVDWVETLNFIFSYAP